MNNFKTLTTATLLTLTAATWAANDGTGQGKSHQDTKSDCQTKVLREYHTKANDGTGQGKDAQQQLNYLLLQCDGNHDSKDMLE